MNKPQVTGRMDRQNGLHKPKMTKVELEKKLKKEYERDHELVTGVFKNYETPASSKNAGVLTFGFKKYAQDSFDFYELQDGQRYTIPRMVASHLNNGCFYKEYKAISGPLGQEGMRAASNADGRLKTESMTVARKVHRFAFNSLEFMDDDSDMYPSDIVEVTTK